MILRFRLSSIANLCCNMKGAWGVMTHAICAKLQRDGSGPTGRFPTRSRLSSESINGQHLQACLSEYTYRYNWRRFQRECSIARYKHASPPCRLRRLSCRDSHISEKVIHTSVVEGDGTGYDILSYHPDGSVKYIEVKSTTGGIGTPFMMSLNEVNFSRSPSDETF